MTSRRNFVSPDPLAGMAFLVRALVPGASKLNLDCGKIETA